MAQSNQLNIEQMLFEAQHRWLRAPEICEILRNHKRFNIAPEPPHLPPSGSLFLFDRKVLRYFRKDGHNWRKKRDGKTSKEAHERLKAGSIDVLHCYYAHGEDNENFQRRSYWMLEEEFSHIVLVHYREVKGYRANFSRFKETEEVTANVPEIEQSVCIAEAQSSLNSGLQQHCRLMLSQNIDSRSLNRAQASDNEDAESGSYQAKSTTASSLEIDEDRSSQKHQKQLWGWEDVLKNHDARVQMASVEPSISSVQSDSIDAIFKQENVHAKLLLTDPLRESQGLKDVAQGPEEWQTMDVMHYLQNEVSVAACKEDKSDVESNLTVEKKSSDSSAARILLDRSVKDEILKNSDSFSQWMCKELGDVEPVMTSSGTNWNADDKRSDCPILSPQDEFDSYTPGPSLSQDQLFKIIDFAPSWGFAGSETKVLITGKFLKTRPDAGNCQWSCMFGEVEVPAEVIADGTLRCLAPPLVAARVPFYVTCSNRLACSEVREFEYRDKFMHGFDATYLRNRFDALQIRFCKLLSLGSRYCQSTVPCNWDGGSDLPYDITSLLKGNDNEWFQILDLSSQGKFSLGEVNYRLVEKLLKEKLYEWLLCKGAEGGKGPCVWDENGQGVLQLAAALGYDWAISPTVAVGVNINFRDVHGWTALHWAAYYGRERTVVYLISLGASAGALTDPTPAYPMGRTCADLASENGHKGIAGFLAESALSAHLECLSFKDKFKQDSVIELSEMTSVLTASERIATPVSSGVNLDGLSLKDSLAAVCNATQAAARIHQAYRSHSFKRKQMRDIYDKKETPDDSALSVITLNFHKQGAHDETLHAAVVRIQNKFRSWKGRREFLKLKQKIVKIQAHVRGHQVRKHYKAFVWSVGIMEKVILRWRRKRSGLRGFKSESLLVKKPQSEGKSSKEDDYDFLKAGRKQAEERLQKALSRVKSMVHYPEARDQYRRMLTTVMEIKEMKNECSSTIVGSRNTCSSFYG